MPLTAANAIDPPCCKGLPFKLDTERKTMWTLQHRMFSILSALALSACAVDVPSNTTSAVEALEQDLTAAECPAPRPKKLGCRVACKPCLIPVCEGGEWVYESVESDGCNPKPLPGDGSCCQVPLSGGCPAECSCCNYN
jgi:hypothetical protein